jgi:hypothetical protein
MERGWLRVDLVAITEKVKVDHENLNDHDGRSDRCRAANCPKWGPPEVERGSASSQNE